MTSSREIRPRGRGTILALVLACLVFINAVPAARAADVGRGSVEVVAEFGGKKIPGAEMRLYYVATPEGSWTDGFAGYGLRLETESESRVGAMANALRALIKRDFVPADATAVTDVDGVARFEGLKPGVWLFTGDDYESGSTTYRVRAGIFVLHSSETVEVEIKYETESVPSRPGRPETTIRKVVKIWDDGGYDARPSRVTVELLRDGRVFDSVVLSDRNDWRYTWTGLDARYEWTVVEVDVPSGYECVVEGRGVTTSVTNVREETESPPPVTPPTVTPPSVPTTPVTPPDSSTTIPVTPPDTSTPTEPVEPGTPPRIPQTGTTWYLVPAFAGGGVASILLGWILVKKGDDDDA